MKPEKTSRLLISSVSPAGEGPLYQQVMDGVKRAITEGRVRPGDALPSFRKLAEDLLVSVITVKRAYEELEREGIIYRRQGLGTFVSEDGSDRNRESKRLRAQELFREAVRDATDAGLSQKEVLDLVRRFIREEGEQAK